jgi:hypothetical protein
MAAHGNIILFAGDGEPPAAPFDLAIRIASLFEKHGLLRQGTSAGLEVCEDCSVTFEERFESDERDSSNYAYVLIQPDQLTEKMGELVYLDTSRGEIELPFVEITVLSEPETVQDFMSGEWLGDGYAAVEFSYEDVRLSEEIHRIRNRRHPFIKALEALLGEPINIGVVCY